MNAIPMPTTYRERGPGINRNRFLARVFLMGMVVLGMSGYFFYQAKGFILGPQLLVSRPQDGETFSNVPVHVEGEMSPNSYASVNGSRMYSDEAGHFSQDILLAPGIHILELVATDRFGKEKKVTRQIYVK